MPEFVHFGSIFATRFKSGKDLRITDSNETMKAAWVAGSGKLIAADPQYLTLSPKFIAGERLLEGKVVSMDGGRYICRLPYVAGASGLEACPDFALLQKWGEATQKEIQFFAQMHKQVVVVTFAPSLIDRGWHFAFRVSKDAPLDVHSLHHIGFLPVLEPIQEYAPENMVGEQVSVVMPGDILHGKLLSCTDYDMVLEVAPGYDAETKFGLWGQWAGEKEILLNRTAMLTLYSA